MFGEEAAAIQQIPLWTSENNIRKPHIDVKYVKGTLRLMLFSPLIGSMCGTFTY